MRRLYRFLFEAQRMGVLEGLFLATEEQMREMIDSKVEIYFGEVLGKHSEIYGEIEDNEITDLKASPHLIEELEKHFKEGNEGTVTICGYNPFDYLGE